MLQLVSEGVIHVTKSHETYEVKLFAVYQSTIYRILWDTHQGFVLYHFAMPLEQIRFLYGLMEAPLQSYVLLL